MRPVLPMILGLGGLALSACTTTPLPPQVASSPIAYAYPTARSGASPAAPVRATPVVAAPAASVADAGANAKPKIPSLIAEPIVVVTPSYRLPSDVALDR